MWAVLYDDGTSLTTVSEPIAHSLAEAERQRGHHVTVRRLDDVAEAGADRPGADSPGRAVGEARTDQPARAEPRARTDPRS